MALSSRSMSLSSDSLPVNSQTNRHTRFLRFMLRFVLLGLPVFRVPPLGLTKVRPILGQLITSCWLDYPDNNGFLQMSIKFGTAEQNMGTKLTLSLRFMGPTQTRLYTKERGGFRMFQKGIFRYKCAMGYTSSAQVLIQVKVLHQQKKLHFWLESQISAYTLPM